eukprot:1649385-Pleurochrysis_carterae.AAC.1
MHDLSRSLHQHACLLCEAISKQRMHEPTWSPCALRRSHPAVSSLRKSQYPPCMSAPPPGRSSATRRAARLELGQRAELR